MNLWQRFREKIGWHKPNGRYVYRGNHMTSTCVNCGAPITQDIHGGWNA